MDPATGRETTGTYIGKFDEDLLRATATVSGGMYFHAGTPGTLRTILKEIDALETSEKRVRIYTRHEQRYMLFLALALALLGSEFLLRHILVKEAL